jgi:methylaspartate mutase sigma subunit
VSVLSTSRRHRVQRPADNESEIIVSSVSSDSHTWNLIFLQLLLEELGHRVTNLGSCVPDDLLIAECECRRPNLIVLSSVNGHGYQEGLRIIRALRAVPALAATPVVIGGKLGTSGADPRLARALTDASFDAVFEDDRAGVLSFRSFVGALPVGTNA